MCTISRVGDVCLGGDSMKRIIWFGQEIESDNSLEQIVEEVRDGTLTFDVPDKIRVTDETGAVLLEEEY